MEELGRIFEGDVMRDYADELFDFVNARTSRKQSSYLYQVHTNGGPEVVVVMYEKSDNKKAEEFWKESGG